ncbi:MAG: hypothetical protein IPP48_08570 [Chitinophagaceae bacterium]|nr:hypothetical protein [Chitinophagaceae bacterium]
MKKIIAYILILLFVTSSSLEVYKDYINGKGLSVSVIESEDDAEKKGIEKENEFAKDKLIYPTFSEAFSHSIATAKYYIKHLHILPNPYISKDINPPNLAV